MKRHVTLQHVSDMNHYVYRLDSEDGEYYIGVRSTPHAPEKDRYMGSGRWCSESKISGRKITKTILTIHESRESANQTELTLIDEHWGNPGFKNRKKITGSGTLGMTFPRSEWMMGNDFHAILDSEVWMESNDTRILWMTMMGLADRTGLVWVAGPILAHFARLGIDQFNDSISRLEELDIVEKVGNVWEIKDHVCKTLHSNS